MEINKKFHRRLKLSILRKHFHALEIEYSLRSDVFVVRQRGKTIYVCFASKMIGEVIRDVLEKMMQTYPGIN